MEEIYKRNLLNLRKAISEKSKRGGYTIFRDEEIEVLLKHKPKTLDELKGLKGFPAKGKRVTNWGEAIVACFGDKSFNLQITGDCDDIENCRIKPNFAEIDVF